MDRDCICFLQQSCWKLLQFLRKYDRRFETQNRVVCNRLEVSKAPMLSYLHWTENEKISWRWRWNIDLLAYFPPSTSPSSRLISFLCWDSCTREKLLRPVLTFFFCCVGLSLFFCQVERDFPSFYVITLKFTNFFLRLGPSCVNWEKSVKYVWGDFEIFFFLEKIHFVSHFSFVLCLALSLASWTKNIWKVSHFSLFVDLVIVGSWTVVEERRRSWKAK